MRPAVIDANVLFPASLRNFLMRLALAEVIRPRWTSDIHDEWIRAVLRSGYSVAPDHLARTRAAMDGTLPDALVHGYASIVPSLTLPDPNDRHVLAAAITCGADTIVRPTPSATRHALLTICSRCS